MRSLTDAGFVVDPNQWYADPVTGKQREIDALVETSPFGNASRPKVIVNTYLVIEAINNLLPFVLLTERELTVNAAGDHYKYWASPDEIILESTVDLNFFEDDETEMPIHSQFCSFTFKKGSRGNKELMASHSDDTFTSLSKLTYYCSNEIVSRYGNWHPTDGYWRIFQWRPVLVLQNELLVLNTYSDGEQKLEPVPHGKLMFHYREDEERTRERLGEIVIDIVTEGALLEFVTRVARNNSRTERELFEYKQNSLTDD